MSNRAERSLHLGAVRLFETLSPMKHTVLTKRVSPEAFPNAIALPRVVSPITRLTQLGFMRSVFTTLLLSLVAAIAVAQTPSILVNFEDVEICDPAAQFLEVDVTVEDFTSVVGAQWTFQWDPAVLTFDHTDPAEGPIDFNLQDLNRSQFAFGTAGGGNFVANGQMTLVYSNGAANGVSVPNDTRIMTLRFDIVNAALSSTVEGNGSIIQPISAIAAPGFPVQGNVLFNNGLASPSDQTDPTFACPGAAVQATAIAPMTAVPVTGIASGAADNCTLSTVTYVLQGATVGMSPQTGINDVSGQAFNVGTTTVTYFATDLAGNTSSCQFDVVVTQSAPSADVEFILPDVTLNCGATTTAVDVRVNGFTDIASFSGVVDFDPTELSFSAVTDLSIDVPGFNQSDFGLNQTASGQLVFLWTENIQGPPPTTASLANGDRLFRVEFDVLSPPTNAVTVASGPRTVLEVIRRIGMTTTNVPVTVDPADFTLNDNEPPVVSNCANQSVDAPVGACEAVVTFSPPTAFDNCDGAVAGVLTSALGPGDLFPVGTTTVSYSFTDQAGNSSTCNLDVVVADAEAPAFTGCPQNQTITTTQGICTGTATWTPPTATDNCTSNVQVTDDAPANGVFPLGTTNVTYTATDDAGNSSTCVFSITVQDGTAPTFTNCPGTQNIALSPGECSFSGSIPQPTATDDCGAVTVAPTSPLPDPFPIGSTTVSFTATDLSGNTAVCEFVVNVIDNESPQVLTCPTALIELVAPANTCRAAAAFTVPTFSDSCPGLTVTSNVSPGDSLEVGLTTVTYTATDAAGNSVNCTFDIRVTEAVAPTIRFCPQNAITVRTTAGACEAMVRFPSLTATDNCDPNPSITQVAGPASGTIFPLGTTTITYEATDASGNMSTCSFDVNVVDFEQPTITCPDNQTYQLVSPNVASTAVNVGATVADNCGTPTLTYSTTGATVISGSGDVENLAFDIGVTDVTYTVTDGSGNTASCTFTITVLAPVGAPTIECPQTQTVDADVNCGAVVSGLALTISSPLADVESVTYELTGATVASSAATGINDASVERFELGTTTVTYTATGSNGQSASCSFDVIVEDNVAPSILTCATDTIRLDATSTACEAVAMFTPPTFEGGCSGIVVASNVSPGDVLPLGATTVLYTATGANGATVSCEFVVLVEASTPPTLTCPLPLTAAAEADSCGATVFYPAATASSACAAPVQISYSVASGAIFPIGTTVVDVTATDANGLSSTCSFEVTVTGTGGIEVADCPDDFAVVADADCNAVASWIEPSFSGDCGQITVTSSHDPGDAFTVGTTTVTYTATSDLGASATCTFNVTVTDNTPPSIDNCPANFTLAAPAGACEASVTWPAITGTDACSGAVVIQTSVANGATLPVGDTIVFVSATDAAGNVATCSFMVSVTGSGLPTFDCPANVVYRTDGQLISDADAFITSGFSESCTGIFLDFVAPSASSDCGDVTVTQIGGAPTGSVFPVGFTNLLFEATTAAGVTSTCEVVIEIQAEPTVAITQLGTTSCVGDDVTLIIPRLNQAVVNWTGPNGFSFQGDTLRLTSVAADQAGLYTVTTRTQGGCEQTASYTLELGADPLPEITTPDFVCGDAGDDLVLQVRDLNGGMIVGYDWSGPNGFSSTEATPIIAAATQAASGTYTVTITSANGCGSATTSKNIVVGSQPNTPLVTVSDPTPCTDQEIIFTGSAYASTSVDYEWTVTPQAGIRLDPVNFVAVVRAEEPGTYNVCYTATVGGCPTQTVCTTINVEAMPSIVLAGRDSLACTDGTRDLVLTETSGSGASYSWRGPSGNVISQAAELRIPNASSANSGLYSLSVMSANGCTADTSVNVRITDRPEAPVLQLDDAIICEGGSATLSASGMGSNVTYQWTANVPNDVAGIPATNNMPLLTVTPMQPGQFIYELRVEQNGCISDVVTVMLEVLESPQVDAQVDGNTDCVLPTQQIQLMGNAAGAQDFRWTGPNGYVSAMANPVLVGPTEAQSGEYFFTATNAFGCESTTSVVLEVTRGVEQLETFLDGDLCRGSTLQLFADEVAGAAYAWAGPNGFTANEQNPVIQSLTPSFSGAYTVTATLPNGCTSEASEPLALDVLASPDAIADQFAVVIGGGTQTLTILDNDDLASGDFTVTLTRTPVFGDAIIGQDGTLSYTSSSESPREDRLEYEVCYLACPDQCARALVTVNVDFDQAECIATTVITPNGDGENDNFYISCVEDPTQNPDNVLVVYNEWGDEVFSAAPYDNTWEGTWEGSELPDGTYYYLFKANANAGEQRGFITIYR